MTTLNFSDQPIRRGQYQPGPTVIGDGADVSALESRVDTAEANIASNADDIAGLQTATDWSLLADYADDTAAAAGGVAVGQLYRNGSQVMVRVA